MSESQVPKPELPHPQPFVGAHDQAQEEAETLKVREDNTDCIFRVELKGLISAQSLVEATLILAPVLVKLGEAGIHIFDGQVTLIEPAIDG